LKVKKKKRLFKKINYYKNDKKLNEEVKNNNISNKNDEYEYAKSLNVKNEENKMREIDKSQCSNKIQKEEEIKFIKNKIPDKKKYVNNYVYNPEREKNTDRELDLGFLPKEFLYNDKSYKNSKTNLLAAIEILEKAQDNKNHLEKKEEKQDKGFWSLLNPFKCGQNS